MSDPLLPPSVQGSLERRDDGTLEGWCWSPEFSDRRLAVEILEGDVVVRVVEAGLYRGDLASRGIGDGWHGFWLEMPLPSPDARGGSGRLIRAREAASGILLGQVMEETGDLSAIVRLDRAGMELASLQAELAGLHARLAARRSAHHAMSPLDQMAAMLAVRSWRAPQAEPGEPAFAVAMAQEELLRRQPGFALPAPPARPSATILLLAASDVHETITALRAIAAGMAELDADIVLVDDGQDARTSLIQGVVRGLVVVPPVGVSLAGTVNAAADVAASANLMVVRAEPAMCSPTALAQLGGAGLDNMILVGEPVHDSLHRWGMANTDDGPQTPTQLILGAPLALVLALPRQMWRDAGGLDSAFDDGGELLWADLCLRARLLGARVRRVRLPAQFATFGSPLMSDPAAAWMAATRFRARWGDLDVATESLR